jgi:hypothetical protein
VILIEPKSSAPLPSNKISNLHPLPPDMLSTDTESRVQAIPCSEEAKVQAFSEKAVLHISDIHWIVEKMLNMVHEIHQDHLAAKFSAKVKDINCEPKTVGGQVGMSPGYYSGVPGTMMPSIVSSPQTPQVSTCENSVLGDALAANIKTCVTEAVLPVQERILSAMRLEISAQTSSLSKQLAKMEASSLGFGQSPSKFNEIPMTPLVASTPHQPLSVSSKAVTYANSDASLDTLHDKMVTLFDQISRKLEDLDSQVQQQQGNAKRSLLKPTKSSLRHYPRHSINQDAEDALHKENMRAVLGDAVRDMVKGCEGEGDKEAAITLESQMEDYHKELEIQGAGGIEKAPALKEDSSFSAVFQNDTDLGSPMYDVESLYKEDGMMAHMARSTRFNGVSQGMICLNAMYIGIDADHNQESNLYNAALPFTIIENVFCIYFVFELVVRIGAFHHVRDCFRDGWIRFDTFLVSTMVFETWIVMPILLYQGGGVDLPIGIFRLMRLLKLTRMARMMKAFPELVLMVKALVRSIRAITGSILLVVVFLYSFAIFMHMLLKNETALNEKLQDELQFDFATIPKCMWTLGMCGVFMLDGAANIATFLVFDSKFHIILSGWTFLIFTLLTAMTILQMLIGVLCEVISSTNREHEASRVVAIMKQQLMTKLLQHDDGDGKITQAELAQLLADPACKALMRSLKINRLYLLEMQKLMFPSKDSAVAFKPLTEIILACRGDNTATVDTVAGGLSFLAGEIRNSDAKLNQMQHVLDDIIKCLHMEE